MQTPAVANPDSGKALCHRLQPRAFLLAAGERGGGAGRLRVAGEAEAASIPMSSLLRSPKPALPCPAIGPGRAMHPDADAGGLEAARHQP